MFTDLTQFESRTRWFLCIALLSPPVHIVADSSVNMFSWTNPSPNEVHDGTGWGSVCLGITDYKPTCGWRIILTSSSTLSHIEVWNMELLTRPDDYTFILENDANNADISQVSDCLPITIHGSFSNTVPTIYVDWYCVCTSVNADCETVPYQSVTPADETVPTTAFSFSLNIQLVSNAPQVSLFSPSNAVSISLKRDPNKLCYGGTLLNRLSSTGRLLDCCASCLRQQDCSGINYWTTGGHCELIADYLDIASPLLTNESGCAYYRVHKKI